MEERLLAILRLALKYKASDIHFIYKYQEISIELRIDGKCVKVKSKIDDYKLIRYLQYLANLDIGNNLIPQTGQFEMMVDGQNLSLRFACINSNNLVNGVLRILNNDSSISLENIFNNKTQKEYFTSLLQRQTGLILLSGPTGSGKTTLLYSLLNSVKNKKIYTLEDPIEVYNDNFVQIQINEEIGLDYQKGIAQVLRHDPDIIMVGEIRESKAAKMAVSAANTGHLVLSTIHCSKACSIITRMIELGVDENHLYENLICLSNQRLLVDEKTHKKRAVFEIMDYDEINYYRKHHENTKDFINIENLT